MGPRVPLQALRTGCPPRWAPHTGAVRSCPGVLAHGLGWQTTAHGGAWPDTVPATDSARGGPRAGRGLRSLGPSVLVQFLAKRLPHGVWILRAEVSTEAVGARSWGNLCAALRACVVGVQILLCEVGAHFHKPVEVGWKDKGIWVTGPLPEACIGGDLAPARESGAPQVPSVARDHREGEGQETKHSQPTLLWGDPWTCV